MPTPETNVKKYFRKVVESIGWTCIPLKAPTKRGWPDQTLFAPGGHVAWIELKAVGAKHSKEHLDRQKRCLDDLKNFGQLAYKVVGNGGVDKLVAYLIYEKGWPRA